MFSAIWPISHAWKSPLRLILLKLKLSYLYTNCKHMKTLFSMVGRFHLWNLSFERFDCIWRTHIAFPVFRNYRLLKWKNSQNKYVYRIKVDYFGSPNGGSKFILIAQKPMNLETVKKIWLHKSFNKCPKHISRWFVAIFQIVLGVLALTDWAKFEWSRQPQNYSRIWTKEGLKYMNSDSDDLTCHRGRAN